MEETILKVKDLSIKFDIGLNIKKFTALPGTSGEKYAVRVTSVVREEQ